MEAYVGRAAWHPQPEEYAMPYLPRESASDQYVVHRLWRLLALGACILGCEAATTTRSVGNQTSILVGKPMKKLNTKGRLVFPNLFPCVACG
jgi:hypothetical protein